MECGSNVQVAPVVVMPYPDVVCLQTNHINSADSDHSQGSSERKPARPASLPEKEKKRPQLEDDTFDEVCNNLRWHFLTKITFLLLLPFL